MSDLTRDDLAELRRLAEAANADAVLGATYERDWPLSSRAVGRFLRALNPDLALELLDAAEERDEIAGRLAHLLCDLTGGRLSKTTYPVPVMVQEIEQYLSECHESDLKDERDDMAATIGRVREWLMSRGVDAGDRDDDWMTGYRTAQRHAVMDAAALLAIIDGAAEGAHVRSFKNRRP